MAIQPDRPLYLAGAIQGMVAWLCYGAVEFGLCYDFPLLFGSGRLISPWAWPLLGIVFVCYAVMGAVSGVLAATILRRREDVRSALGPAVTLSLVLAFAANLIPEFPLARSEYIALGVAGLLGVATFLSVRSQLWRETLAGITNPWAASLAFVAAPWLSRMTIQDAAGGVKLAVSLAAIGGVFGLAWVTARRWPKSRPLASMAVVAGIILTGFAANHGIGSLPRAEAARLGASNKPNVVLITMDTVRADHLSVYGYERDTTPHLRALAREATVYRRAIASGDMTLPTHASLFTGLYASWHGAHYDPPGSPYGKPLDNRYQTLAASLGAKGYTTLAVAANYGYVSEGLGMSRGFQVFDSRSPVRLTEKEGLVFLREGVQSVLNLVTCTAAFDRMNRQAEEINGDALRLLDSARETGRPFFLFLNYMDAHTPYAPPEPFAQQFAGKDRTFRFNQYLKLQNEFLAGRRKVTERERAHLISQYDGGIAYIDTAVGNLIVELRKRGLYEQTMLVVMGDHGEAFGETRRLGHAVTSVNQDQVHVPFIVKYPGERNAKVTDELVTQIDVMPTVLETLGYAIPPTVQGLSLLHPVPMDRFVIAEAFPSPFRPRTVRGIFQGPDKLIVSGQQKPEYFEPWMDLNEAHDRYQPGDASAAKLQAKLQEWVRKIPNSGLRPSNLDPQSLQRLKSLGYVQ